MCPAQALAAPSKEQLIVLVWADPRLLEEASLDAEVRGCAGKSAGDFCHVKSQTALFNQEKHRFLWQEFEDLSWLEVMSRVVAAILRQKIITAASDETAVIFFNTVRLECWGERLEGYRVSAEH